MKIPSFRGTVRGAMVLWLVLGAGLAVGQGGTREARMPVRIVAGRLVVRCEVSTRFRRLPVNLFLDYARPCGLELHNKAAAGIRVDDGGGVPITVHLPGFDISVERREHGDEDLLDEFTRLYSRELGETACVGAIGSLVLNRYHVTFDLNAGFVYLRNPQARTGGAPENKAGSFVTSLTLVNNMAWMPVRLSDGRLLQLGLSTSHHDTLVGLDLCDSMDRPAGNIGSVMLNALDISGFVAFRPSELALVHPDGVFGRMGLNLLSCLRVEIDRENRYARISQTAEASFPEEEFRFFEALVEEDADVLSAWLEKYPQTRLAREGAGKLLNLRLDDDASTELLTQSLEWVDRTRIADLRATESISTMKSLVEMRRPKVAIQAGRIGIRSGRKDRYPESVHRLHSKVGELLLDQDLEDEAWEHLLSAAFGLPEDGMINLHLGRCYEKQERYRRAMSRYLQAVIAPESGPRAIEGLERVQLKLAGEPLSVDVVDKMIAGKVYNFGAATRFEADESTATNRVVLAELFTNAHFGRRLKEGWRSFAVGGAMGVEGLLSHFPRTRLAVLTYHVDTPQMTALMNPLTQHLMDCYSISDPQVSVINGIKRGPGAGRSRDAEVIYERNRNLVLGEMARPSSHEVSIKATLAEGVLKGSVVVKGPPGDELAVQIILVERGVLYPGKARVVVHRMVARGVLTDDPDGVPFEPVDGGMEVSFRDTLDNIQSRNRTFLEKFEKRASVNATRLSLKIDPRQVAIVALVRDVETMEVLQVDYLDLNQQAGAK